ncbi:hypothetical protein F5144DRAFT_479889, partial [Chaetomium tenue]
MTSLSLLIFSLAVPVRALDGSGGPQDWNDFTNNFATDLAPIIVLFGEQASKQFLSESTSFWDNILFGIAPIGIITAVISTIRLYGNSSLKAFIGRAQEAHGVAEAELCSSTSDDVCELWSNGGICRVFGRPRILELFRIKPKGSAAFYPSFVRQVNTKRPPSCGLYPPQNVLCGDELPPNQEDAAEPLPNTSWREIRKKRAPLPSAVNAQERGRFKAFAPRPNLSLNIGIKAVPPGLLRMTTLLGTALQLSFFGYATWATFYYPDLYKGESLPTLWSFCLAIAGTVILSVGMVCCAMLIEKMSMERRFKNENSSQDTTMFWLQPGNQRIGDQLFNAFAYSEKKESFITSWKVDLELESERFGIVRLSKHTFQLWVAIGSSTCGFICQFLGLRGLHGSVALYQLGVTLCMAIVRSFLRSGRLGADKNNVKQRRDVEGHELDWQAMNLEEPDKEFQEKADAGIKDVGVDVAPGSQQIVSFHVRRDRDLDTLQSAKAAVSWMKHNEAAGDQPNEAARILHYRASLAYLTGNAIQAAEQRWDTEVRAMAKRLQKAMQEAAEHIFLEVPLLRGWRDTRSLAWSATCRLHERPAPSNSLSPNGTATQQQSFPIHFAMYHNAGVWEISECELEAALGLWYWSVSRLPWASRSSQRKVFMVERAEKRNSLISAIRLWVTQTHHIDPFEPCVVPQEASSHGPAQGDSQPDGICLSVATESSLLQLVAQDIFGIFISRIADILQTLDVAEPWTRGGQIQPFGVGNTMADDSYIGLTNKHVRVLADVLVSAGLGSRVDALMTIIPPLLQRSKLPDTDAAMESLLYTAKTLRRNNKFTQAENLL